MGTPATRKTKARVQSLCRSFAVSWTILDCCIADATSAGPIVCRTQRLIVKKTRKARPTTSSDMSSRRWLNSCWPVAFMVAWIQMSISRAKSQPANCFTEETSIACLAELLGLISAPGPSMWLT